jgi:peptidylprolyl isomerase
MSKPEVDFVPGPPPTELQITDLVAGEGDEAVPGGVVDVHYVGVEFETGEEFDSSWDRGQSARFPLPQLIGAWQQGIPGMKVGGRRQLVIPPDLGYGAAGGPGIAGGETLVFIVDLVSAS